MQSTEGSRNLYDVMSYIFYQLAWTDIVVFFSGVIFAGGMIICFLIMPLICHFYIVPGIEKKTGKKLGYSPAFNLTPGGRYLGRSTEISKYILDIYYAKKKYGARGLPQDHGRYALKQVGFTIDMVSRGELIFSFTYRIFFNITGIALLIGGTIACFESYVLKKY